MEGIGEQLGAMANLFLLMIPLSLMGLWKLGEVLCWLIRHLHWS
jgi:hypothetical protein